MVKEVHQVCTTIYDDMDPNWTDDYDPTQTAEYEAGFEDGAAEEREKWLPLWEAVKELEPFEQGFTQDSEDLEPSHNQARRELYRVLLVLRSQGEK